MRAKYENDTEIAKAKRDYELKKAAYDIEVFTKVCMARLFVTSNCKPFYCLWQSTEFLWDLNLYVHASQFIVAYIISG